MTRRLRVCLVALGSRGDVQPSLVLAAALRARGHGVRVAGPAAQAGVADVVSVPYRSIGGRLDGLLTGTGASGIASAWQAAPGATRDVLVDLLQETAAASTGADVVVGSGVHPLGASAAELVGARYVYLAMSPLSVPSGTYPPAVLGGLSLPRLGNRLAWRIARQLANAALLAAVNGARAHVGLPRVADVLRHAVHDHPTLHAYSQRLAPPDPSWDERRVHVGPLFELPGATRQALAPEIRAFLVAGERPLYIGFGSMRPRDPLRTLRALLEAGKAAGVRLLLGGEWGPVGGGGGRTDRQALLVPAVSHASLFPEVAAVVHHGGSGTTHAGLMAGRPSLLMPFMGDQHVWARRVHALGAGPAPLPFGRLTAEPLAGRLRSLVADSTYASTAARLASELQAEATSAPDAAVSAIERLAH